jgi:hypothetical protein
VFQVDNGLVNFALVDDPVHIVISSWWYVCLLSHIIRVFSPCVNRATISCAVSEADLPVRNRKPRSKPHGALS